MSRLLKQGAGAAPGLSGTLRGVRVSILPQTGCLRLGGLVVKGKVSIFCNREDSRHFGSRAGQNWPHEGSHLGRFR